jgi:hypothetical protein
MSCQQELVMVGLSIVLSLSLLGCHQDRPTDRIDPEAYDLNFLNTQIRSEYSVIECVPGESRQFFVGGVRGNSDQTYVGVFDQNVNNVGTYQLRNDKNAILYSLDSQNPLYGKYTAPLRFDAPSLIGGYYYSVRLGSQSLTPYVSASIQIEVVQRREYSIEYSYAPGYDIFPLGSDPNPDKGLDMKTSIERAFALAGTTVKISNLPWPSDASTTLEYNVEYVPSNQSLGRDEQLDQWALYHRSGGLLHDTHIAPVFSFSKLIFMNTLHVEVQTPAEWTNLAARTFSVTDPSNNSTQGSTFLFVDWIGRTNLTGDYRTREYDRAIIHELGHQRGITLDHDLGHNGVKKPICVVFQPDHFAGNTQQLLEYLTVSQFCEGHNQLLLNVTW